MENFKRIDTYEREYNYSKSGIGLPGDFYQDSNDNIEETLGKVCIEMGFVGYGLFANNGLFIVRTEGDQQKGIKGEERKKKYKRFVSIHISPSDAEVPHGLVKILEDHGFTKQQKQSEQS
ncbi:hypothetical protein J4221_07380 [Candidatus Pacearchaeota archaeon]|nr:hypothetical protein [Candidatus Pacearchaeota archaeon]